MILLSGYRHMEFGIYSFAEIGPDPITGKPVNVGQRLQHLLEEIELAEKVGLDVYAVGEHHRPDYAVSSPAVGTLQQLQ